MTDRELIELAAKAARYNVDFSNEINGYFALGLDEQGDVAQWWNPLISNEDAFCLMVSCGISILPYPVYSEKERHSVICVQKRASDLLREKNQTYVIELYEHDMYSATRRAVVRCAAEIGRENK